MRLLNFHISILALVAVCTASCIRHDSKANCFLDTSKSNDAFDYPNLHNKDDTDILAYQLRNILSQRDSFIHVTFGLSYLRKFGEPNLSLRFLGTETFRFSYNPWKGPPINISFNEQEIIVKTGIKGAVYPVTNMDKLDSLEKIKFSFCERNFFARKDKYSPARKRYYDSMTKKYPELISIRYYKSLFDKSLDNDSSVFEYRTKKMKLSPKQYCDLIDSLNRSGFCGLPWKLDYPEGVADGGGYTFEANTKHKYKIFICFGLPIDSLRMTNFCRHLIRLAGVDKKITL